MRNLVWLNNDLRVRDNAALAVASRGIDSEVMAFFAVQVKAWKKLGYGENKIRFLLRNLQRLAAKLGQYNIPLQIEELETDDELINQILKVVKEQRIQAFYYNRRYLPYWIKLEKRLTLKLRELNVEVHALDDELLYKPGSVLTSENKFYTVFTPFKRRFIKYFVACGRNIDAFKVSKQQALNVFKFRQNINWDELLIGDETLDSLWPAGEDAALKLLQKFIRDDIDEYATLRDYPALDATSRLSPYLALGVISIRDCFRAGLKANGGELEAENLGATTWLAELIWREFYKNIAYAFPNLSFGKPFKSATQNWPWRHDKAMFKKWCNGQTGFPIVDAAMRQLNQTGWMHNRLRMIVASFLTKLLHVDWRWGEEYFAKQLIDYDFAANNGGWQWSASTGADSVPYFRIFNPMLQSKRYDQEGEFIKHYLPELDDVPNKMLYDPYRYERELTACGYPKPIIDYKKERKVRFIDEK